MFMKCMMVIQGCRGKGTWLADVCPSIHVTHETLEGIIAQFRNMLIEAVDVKNLMTI